MEQEEAPLGKTTLTAKFMASYRPRQGPCASGLAKELGCSVTHARHMLCATAAVGRQTQDKALQAAVSFVSYMVRGGSMEAIQFCWRQAYDETALRARVSWDGAGAETEQARVWILNVSWTVLVRWLGSSAEGKPPFLVLHSAFSPTSRATDNTKGESIAGLLESSPLLLAEVKTLFKMVVVVSETDQCPANVRGEKLWHAYTQQAYSHMQLFCMCHRLHTCAAKTMAQTPEVLTGVIRSVLSLMSSMNYAKLKRALYDEVEAKLEIVQENLSVQALDFRRQMLSVWLPKEQHARKRALSLVTAATVMTADWRVPKVQHLCQNCCAPRAESVCKVQFALAKLFRALRCSSVSRGNWAEWSTPMSVIGLFWCMHRLLPAVVSRAFVGPGPVSK